MLAAVTSWAAAASALVRTIRHESATQGVAWQGMAMEGLFAWLLCVLSDSAGTWPPYMLAVAGPRSELPATRREALLLQDLAEAHCTATYRPPELFDVQTGRTLDYAAADVWGAGCTLFATMYGASPFQRALDERDGSLALAVLSCKIMWPREGEPQYPAQLHELVTVCLALDPAQRPTAVELQRRAKELLWAGL
eukprot:365763-Chlamydomonas_euryale.AAC.34